MAKNKSVNPPGVNEKSTREDDMAETPDAPVNVKGVEPPSADEIFVPKVNVSSRGKISQTLQGVADEFRRLNQSMDCRWVYHSATKPELSNVMSRTAEGYTIVKPDDLKGSSFPMDPFIDEKGHVRIADVILMGIPAGQRKVNAEARMRLADDQVRRVKESFQQSMEATRSGQHRAVARGAVNVREKDHDLSYDQPNKE